MAPAQPPGRGAGLCLPDAVSSKRPRRVLGSSASIPGQHQGMARAEVPATPSPVGAPGCRERRRSGPVTNPPGAGKSTSLGDEWGTGRGVCPVLCSPAEHHSPCRGSLQGQGLLTRPLRRRAGCSCALLGCAVAAGGEEGACPFSLPCEAACLPPASSGDVEAAAGGRACRSPGGSLCPRCGRRLPEPHVCPGVGSPFGKGESRADGKHVNAQRWSYL